jgi:hypothetical protein
MGRDPIDLEQDEQYDNEPHPNFEQVIQEYRNNPLII